MTTEGTFGYIFEAEEAMAASKVSNLVQKYYMHSFLSMFCTNVVRLDKIMPTAMP